MHEKLLTIFTPTYNRDNLLQNLYTSLKNQTSKNFKWLIVDDGSTDKTREIVTDWIASNNDFCIEYYFKDNGGLQSGYVEAIKHLTTELALCIDSDDIALPDTVEAIEIFWESIPNRTQYAGIYGLDCYASGEVLGGFFQEDNQSFDLRDFTTGKIRRTSQDRALVVRSDLYKQTIPAKRYPGERTMNATYLHLQISENYRFILLNRPLIQVEYQADGLSRNKKKHYYTAPNTFADWRIYLLSIPKTTFAFRFRQSIHYVSSCLFAKRHIVSNECPHKPMIIAAIPFGIMLNIYIRISNWI